MDAPRPSENPRFIPSDDAPLECSDVEAVLARLKDYGYLDDARFAESFASARLENEGFGKSRVLRDLRQHRVSPDLAQRTVSKVYAEKDEPTLIEEYIRHKYRTAGRRRTVCR